MKKGLNKERELVNYLNNQGFKAVRIAGSGAGTKKDTCDILASNKRNIYAIELKSSSKDNIYINQKQIKELINFSNDFGSVPVVAVKFSYKPFIFLFIDNLNVTDKGNFKINRLELDKFKNKTVLG